LGGTGNKAIVVGTVRDITIVGMALRRGVAIALRSLHRFRELVISQGVVRRFAELIRVVYVIIDGASTLLRHRFALGD